MFVVGFDPGLSNCGYAVLEYKSASAGVCRALGVIRTDPSEPVQVRLASLRAECAALLDEWKPSVAAVERLFFQANVKTAISVAQASGVLMAELGARGVSVCFYTPGEVKLAVGGDGSAGKHEMRRMVGRLLGLREEVASPDAADAAAVALCHLAHEPVTKAAGRYG